MLLGKYKLLKTIGQGGVGRVFLAQHQQNQKLYAIKEVYNDEGNLRFRREYNLLSAIDHPNIVKAYDFFSMNDKWFMVMEYVEGLSLGEFIRQNSKLSTKALLAIAIQISRAVEVVNSTGIIHRDIKPGNIMVDNKNHIIKILDLGMGKHLDNFQESRKLTKTGAVVGTVDYMSPEQMNGKLYDNSDVFSVGITLYQLFRWEQESVFACDGILHTMNNVAKKKLPPFPKEEIKRHEMGIYKEIYKILKQAVEKDSLKRTKSCCDLAQALNKAYLKIRGSGKSAWKPSSQLDSKSLVALKEIKEKFPNIEQIPRRTNRYKNNRKVSKHSTLYPILLIATFILFIGLWKFLPNSVASKETFSSLLTHLQQLDKQQNYKQMHHIIAKLDNKRGEFFHAHQAKNNKEKFIQEFYLRNRTQDTLDLGAKILRDHHSALSLFFNVRLFVLKGEYTLATWYSGVLYNKYPVFFKTAKHPALCIFTHRHFEAFELLQEWKTAPQLIYEKHCCQFFLDIILLKLYTGTNSPNKWSDYKLPQAIRNSFFSALFHFIKTDFYDNAKNPRRWPSVQKSAFSVPGYEKMHSINHRLYTLQIELQKNFSGVREKLQPFIDKYPDFLPSKIAIGEFSPNDFQSISRDRGTLDEIKGTLYQCILAYSQQQNIKKFQKCADSLVSYIPNWHFSHIYKSDAEQQNKRLFDSIMSFLRGVQIDHSVYARRRNKIEFLWKYLKTQEKLSVVFELKWFIHMLDFYKSQPGVRYIKFLNQLQNQQQRLISLLQRERLYNTEYNALLQLLLRNKKATQSDYRNILRQYQAVPNIEENVFRHMIMVQQFDTCSQLLTEKNHFPLLKCILLIRRTEFSTKKNLLHCADLLKTYNENNPSKKHGVLFYLEVYNLVLRLINKKVYKKAREVLSYNNNIYYIANAQRLTRHQEIESKLERKSPVNALYVNQGNILLGKYIEQQQFGKAQKLAHYIKYLSTLERPSPQEIKKLNNYLEGLNEVSHRKTRKN
ncbi:serine/threonine-protein kinase [Candidatus Uabimicrobium sp. HlEnr_7]|uniref:serine/threonine-protein kinase n=1 Tax=Candidatus Uabimicrobium helgolandensis TaxID=3095367 RepID=UPI0035565728